MKRAESATLARQTYHYFENEGARDVTKTCRYFEKLGYKYDTIYRILKRTLQRSSTELLPNPGRTRTVTTAANIEQVKRIFEEDRNVSVREASKTLKISTTSVFRMKAHDLGIRAYVKQSAPKYTDGQQERARVGCGKVLKQLRGRVLIMDDETYVPLDPKEVHGKEYYHAVDKAAVPDAERYKGV